jgi:hypothetical protein
MGGALPRRIRKLFSGNSSFWRSTNLTLLADATVLAAQLAFGVALASLIRLEMEAAEYC